MFKLLVIGIAIALTAIPAWVRSQVHDAGGVQGAQGPVASRAVMPGAPPRRPQPVERRW